MVRLRPVIPPDPRLLIVEISEADLRALNRPTPSDRDLAEVIRILSQHQPSVIGLDLHRELPQEPGHTELLQQLQTSNVVAILELGAEEIEIPPPPGVPDDRVGFSDIAIDADNVVRRNLLFGSNASGDFFSFSTQLAFKYLEKQGITPQDSRSHPGNMQLGETSFLPLEKDAGGYQNLDAVGYQVLLDYRSASSPAPMVSFTQVLNGEIDPSLVQDKIVLIGTTAPSSKDLFYTPYSAALQTNHTMPGVVVHAQMVSQVLGTVLDGKPLFWFAPEWLEITWIGGWAVIGGCAAWRFRHPITLGFSVVILVIGLSGISLLLFLGHGWLPIATPAIALILTSIAIVSYRAYTIQ
ncbi:MAG: CHASE2 domain-containing protein [Cyanobacteria bacterium RU_5_0]|nr:CHASE2 domain-containing protein [Cyanobacteria bacterium RU_5_0]